MLKRLPCLNREEISALDFIVSNPDSFLDSETLTTLGATGSENAAAALGSHAGTEAVALSPFTGVRLIGAFH